MNTTPRRHWLFVAIQLAITATAAPACTSSDEQTAAAAMTESISPRVAADMVHAALAADREVYTKEVVQRLTVQQKVQVVVPGGGGAAPLEAREDWRSEHAKLPLPAQMFRMGAEKVLGAGDGFSYLLLSPWPVNAQNRARTDVEKRGLDQVTATGEVHYDSETLDGQRYFVAIYPDKAVAEACVTCHNKHPDSPRRDFKVGDTMGAMVIRFRLSR